MIWLYDSQRSLYIYLAHLQTRDVKQNTWVDAGQTVGTVGNTGNARTTPPHLHFGLYSRGEGPIDPYNFIHEIPSEPAAVSAELELLGKWVRTSERAVILRAGSGRRSSPIAELKQYTPCKVMAATREEYRILLPDQQAGYIPAGSVETIKKELQVLDVAEAQIVRSLPRNDAPPVVSMYSGDNFSILGEFQGFWFVRTPDGDRGWLPVVSTHPRT